MAEELAADVFRVAWQKWDEASSVDVAWLFTVARNLLGNAYRSHRRQVALHERLRESVVSGDGPETDTRWWMRCWIPCGRKTGTSCSWRTGIK